jgi:hypothetical protein
VRQRIFIGSASEHLEIAKAIEANLSTDHEPTLWDASIFDLTKDILSGLLERLSGSDVAVFVLAPADVTKLRDTTVTTARDNVIFELGLFIGRLGRERTYFVAPRGAKQFHVPSDLLGLVAAEYDPARSDKNWDAAVSPACTAIRRAMRNLQTPSAEPPRTDVLADGLAWMQQYVNKALTTLLHERDAPILSSGVVRGDREYAARLERTQLRIRFGDICDCDATTVGAVVALPANEFFDDACMEDTRSALGAYMARHFPGKVKDMQALLVERLADVPSELVERERNDRRSSYGVARCVYLSDAFGCRQRVMFTSVTTKRTGVGLRCESRYLFAAMKSICREMRDYRLSDLYVPLMGSGHGGIEPELALLYMLLSLKAVADEPGGCGWLRSVTIVVHTPGDPSSAIVAPDVVERLLALVSSRL